MVKHPIFGEVSKNFNETEALKALELFEREPQYGHALLQMHAHERVSEIKYTNPEIVDELIFKKYDQRKAMVKDAVLAGVINKSMSNSTVDEIAKAMDSVALYTERERAENAKKQRRDTRGRFVPMGKTRVDQPQARNPKDKGEWEFITRSYDKVAQNRRLGTPATVKNVNPKFDAQHSAAYLQVADAVKQIDPGGLIMADVTFQKQNKKTGDTLGDTRSATIIGSTAEEFVRTADFEEGWVPTNYNWYMDQDSARGGGFDLLTGAGMSGGQYIAGAEMASAAPGALKGYTGARSGEYKDDEYGSRAYNKLGATAQMVETIGGDNLSGKAKWALGAAKYVGENGPEAEKVLGPTARRAAYRYRGVERKPDDKMDRSIAMSVQGSKSVNDARERLIHPTVVGGNDRENYTEDIQFSPFIRYWQNQLPKKQNLNLHLNSGAIAPSQGVVFDSKGQIVTQAVGYGDDHYLPFNLQNLSRANRGEWVRTRTMGGPTTEDIYAALTTGTRSVTVVSHSGVYNIEFDESFRGGRRYNDKAARMVRRYSQLLDTLDAENTTLQDVPQDRREEIELKVHREILGNSQNAVKARKEKYDDLIDAERNEPSPSKAQKEMWRQEFVQEFADSQNQMDDNRVTADEVTWEQIKARESIRAEKELTDDEVITSLGQTDRFERFMNKKTKEYKTLQAPLKLNGQGYYFALQALQEQFPYYIKRVEWYPPNDTKGSVYGKDKGYVKRNFNRPESAREGFWAKDIEGYNGMKGSIKGKEVENTGKQKANYTNYQNFANRQRVNTADSEAEAKSAEMKNTKDGVESGVSTDLGIRMDIKADPAKSDVMDRQRRLAVVALAKEIKDLNVEVKDSETGMTDTKKIGDSTLGYNLLGNWARTESLLEDPDASKTVDELEQELDSIFSGKAGSANAKAVTKAVRGPLTDKYNETVLSKRVKPVVYAGSALSDDKSIFNLGEEFMPGRNIEEYKSILKTDPDIEAIKGTPVDDRRFPERFKKAETDLLNAEATEDPNALVTYLDDTYIPADWGDLKVKMRSDALGFLKMRQLQKNIAGAVNPEAEEPEATVSPMSPPPTPPVAPVPDGGAALAVVTRPGSGIQDETGVAERLEAAAPKASSKIKHETPKRGTKTYEFQKPSKEDLPGYLKITPSDEDEDEKK